MTVIFRPAVDTENCGTYPDPAADLPRGDGLISPRDYAIEHYSDTIGGGLTYQPITAAQLDDDGNVVEDPSPILEIEPALMRYEGGVPVIYPRGELVAGMLGAPVWVVTGQHDPE